MDNRKQFDLECILINAGFEINEACDLSIKIIALSDTKGISITNALQKYKDEGAKDTQTDTLRFRLRVTWPDINKKALKELESYKLCLFVPKNRS